MIEPRCVMNVLRQATGLQWAVTSWHRSGDTRHDSGDAVDLAPRSGPLYETRRQRGLCPDYDRSRSFLGSIRNAAQRLYDQCGADATYVEADHVHTEQRRQGVVTFGTYSPPLHNSLCSRDWVTSPHYKEDVMPYEMSTLPINLEMGGGEGHTCRECGGNHEEQEFGGLSIDDVLEAGGYDEDELGAYDGDELGARRRRTGRDRSRGRGREPKQKGRPKGRDRGRPGMRSYAEDCPCGPASGMPTSIESRGAPVSGSIPYIVVPSDVRVNFSPVPVQYRLRREEALHMLRDGAVRTARPPLIVSQAPAAGAYTLEFTTAMAAGDMYQVACIALDVGPNTLSTQAGAQMTATLIGTYTDGQAANLGQINFQIPRTNAGFRLLFFPYQIINGIAVPKMLTAGLTFRPPFIPATLAQANDSGGNVEAAIPVPGQTVLLNFTGTVPAGLQITGTLVTPTSHIWPAVIEALEGRRYAC